MASVHRKESMSAGCQAAPASAGITVVGPVVCCANWQRLSHSPEGSVGPDSRAYGRHRSRDPMTPAKSVIVCPDYWSGALGFCKSEAVRTPTTHVSGLAGVPGPGAVRANSTGGGRPGCWARAHVVHACLRGFRCLGSGWTTALPMARLMNRGLAAM